MNAQRTAAIEGTSQFGLSMLDHMYKQRPDKLGDSHSASCARASVVMHYLIYITGRDLKALRSNLCIGKDNAQAS